MGDGVRETLAIIGSTCVIGGGAIVGASSTDNTAPILAFVGALLVALLTAYSAHRLQAASLAAEDKRQQRALSEESARQRQQLRHDRQLHDLRDLREVVESSLGAYDAMFEVALFVLAARTANDPEPDGTEEQWKVAMRAMDEAINKIEIRLGDQDPILVAQRQLVQASHEIWNAASEGDQDAFTAAREKSGLQYRLIVQGAKDRIGSSTNPDVGHPRIRNP